MMNAILHAEVWRAKYRTILFAHPSSNHIDCFLPFHRIVILKELRRLHLILHRPTRKNVTV